MKIVFKLLLCTSKREQIRINQLILYMRTKTKSDFIKVRVTQNEKKMLEYHAIQLNITISELVRKFIIIKS